MILLAGDYAADYFVLWRQERWAAWPVHTGWTFGGGGVLA